ncbi:hypothetical protein PFISCL1PPCAC_13181, partial [Pristionchus fissidentatus]
GVNMVYQIIFIHVSSDVAGFHNEGLGELLHLIAVTGFRGLELCLNGVRSAVHDVHDIFMKLLIGNISTVLVCEHDLVEDCLSLGGELGDQGLGEVDHFLFLVEAERDELLGLLLLVGGQHLDSLIGLGDLLVARKVHIRSDFLKLLNKGRVEGGERLLDLRHEVNLEGFIGQSDGGESSDSEHAEHH